MDLGVLMQRREKEAILTVGTIWREINRVKDAILRLYKRIDRPQLEYYIR